MLSLNLLLLSFISFFIIFLLYLLFLRIDYLNFIKARINILYSKSKFRSNTKRILKKKEIKIFKVIFELVIFLLLIYAALAHKVFFVVVVSNSMYPTFERGDLVLVQSILIDPKPGDIIMFSRPDINYPITHRVISISQGKIYTGGDASGPDDFVLSRKDVIAEVVQLFNKPVVIKGVGNYFILDAKELRDIGPYGEEYIFYKRLVDLFKTYALAIIIISILLYIYLSVRVHS